MHLSGGKLNQIYGAGAGFLNTVEQQEASLNHSLMLLVHQYGVTLLEGCLLNSDQMSQHLSPEILTEQP